MTQQTPRKLLSGLPHDSLSRIGSQLVPEPVIGKGRKITFGPFWRTRELGRGHLLLRHIVVLRKVKKPGQNQRSVKTE